MKIQTWAVALTLILLPAAGFAGPFDEAPYATGTDGIVAGLKARISQDRTQWAFLKVRESQIHGKVEELRTRRDAAKKKFYALNDSQLNSASDAFDQLTAKVAELKVDFNGQDVNPVIDDQEKEVDRLASLSKGDADPLAFEAVDNSLRSIEKRSAEIDKELSDRYLDAGYVSAGLEHAVGHLEPPMANADSVSSEFR